MHNNMHMFWEKTDNGSKQGATDELTLRSLICSEAILLQPIFVHAQGLFTGKVNIKAFVGWCHFQIR